MPRSFAAQKVRSAQAESRPRIDREASAASGRFMGDVSPTQTWQALESQTEAVLIDVRTRAEWAFVGGPDLASLGKSVIQVEWQTFPNMERNPRFVKELQAQGITPEQSIYIICRSGIRSRDAAELLAKLGYTTWNVAEGFEGSLNAEGHRGASGWRAEKLPWKQS